MITRVCPACAECLHELAELEPHERARLGCAWCDETQEDTSAPGYECEAPAAIEVNPRRGVRITYCETHRECVTEHL